MTKIREFRQARWGEPSIFELGFEGRTGHSLPKLESEILKTTEEPETLLPESLVRKTPPNLPQLSEVEVVRHFTRLSQMNFCLDLGIYPLGSCTMKYNPKIDERLAYLEESTEIHPWQDTKTIQGSLEILYKLSRFLEEITGTDKVTLQPSAGAHGELLGILILKAYHQNQGELKQRTEVLIPDSAHGTNPASAMMGGFKIVVIPSSENGCVDVDALQAAISERTAGLMLTNPNTLGIFEEEILEISKMIHESGGLLYYDGANLNAVLGKSRPGDMGFDIVHVNLHKTFSTPHGGGGPGSGPVGVKGDLERFLPIPTIEFDGEKYYLDYDRPHTIGKVGGFYGNFSVLLRAFAYILHMGSKGLREAAELSVLNANYIAHELEKIPGLKMPYSPNKPRKHEAVLSASEMNKKTGVRALNVSKRILDFGMHAPTTYFPLIVDEALMIEPTETETKEDLDRYIESMNIISKEAFSTPKMVQHAPSNTSVSRLDEVKASHPKTLCLTWKMFLEKEKQA
jgi:glycine dehydrogenase subunit 2